MVYGLAVTTVLGLGTALIFGYGGYLVYRDQFVNHVGEQGMTVGKLYLFISYVAQFYGPLNRITGSGADLPAVPGRATRVSKCSTRTPTSPTPPTPSACRASRARWKLRDVSFATQRER